MKNLKKETPHLFIRLNDFDDYDYIEEHLKICESKGNVWILKLGKSISKEYINDILKAKGLIIFKTTKKKGNKFYCADLLSDDVRKVKEGLYPDYYKEYLYYSGLSIDYALENGFWFNITNIREIPNKVLDRFILKSNKKRLYDYAVNTRVVHMYTINKDDIEI